MNDTFHRSMFVVMMLRCLKKLGYFGEDVKERANNEEEAEVMTEDEIYIATLLCHFLELMQFNSHEVAQVIKIPKSLKNKTVIYFFGSIGIV